MKPLILQLILGETFVTKIEIDAGLQLRLMAHAKANKMELSKMVHLALRFALADDGKSPLLRAPDEGDIINLGAEMLTESGRL